MKGFLKFVAGIGVGIAISWSYHKNKYEEMIQEEVESLRNAKKIKHGDAVKEEFLADENKKGTDVKEEIDNASEEAYKEEIERAKTIINYNKYSTKRDEERSCEKTGCKNPLYIITPDEFASRDGYDTDTFYIFEDNIIADDNNKRIDNVKETFGLTVEEIRDQFGVYEEDSVYIRNEKIDMDYEILRELDTYEKRNGE